jgi:hypothetical protein
MMFGACRGVFSQVFQNNWVNGSLYMFSFKKKTIFSITGQPKKYQFCGSYDSLFRPGQGPVFYAEGKTNGLYYRATPYTGSQFVGQVPKRKLAPLTPFIPAGYGGMNERNLYFPTTIMDLGPRDQFTKEICVNPQFEGYLMETFQSTSFNDTSDLLQLFIISRLINSNFLTQMLGIGDASINRMFSRSEDRIDGDIAQLFSINSEYGVEGFSDDVYDDDTLYVAGSGDALVGVFFTGSTENRIKLTPGITTFTPTLTLSKTPSSARVNAVSAWGTLLSLAVNIMPSGVSARSVTMPMAWVLSWFINRRGALPSTGRLPGSKMTSVPSETIAATL